MNLLQAIIMGIVQGLTEFLPISSSGHLVLLENLIGVKAETGIFFAVMLHVGTLFSVVIVFYKDIFHIIREFFLMTGEMLKGRGLAVKRNPYRNMAVMIIIATIPTGVIGIVFNDMFEGLFSSVRAVSVTLLVTGIILYISDKLNKGRKKPEDIRVKDAVVVGLFQGAAITPGISRSGSTIFGGLLMGFNRELATKFSFILSIPAIGGAALLEGMEFIEKPAVHQSLFITVAGMLSAAVAGTFAIRFLVVLLNRGKLHYFSYYCWCIGILALIASFYR